MEQARSLIRDRTKRTFVADFQVPWGAISGAATAQREADVAAEPRSPRLSRARIILASDLASFSH
jgi:hypothetical protein